MKIMVTSFRGDHNAVVEDVEVCEAVFNKLTGQRKEALPEAFKTRIPDTFQELEGLWKDGELKYTAISQDANGEMIGLKDFKPEAAAVVFLAPIAAG